MKIAFDALSVDNRSGTGRYARKLCEQLVRLFPEAEFLVFLPLRAELDPDVTTARNVETIRLRSSNSLMRIAFEQSPLVNLARRRGASLVHFPASISALSLPLPSVVTLHDLAYLRLPECFTTSRRLYYRFAMAHSARRASMVITDSEATRRDVIDLFRVPESKVFTVHLGVDSRMAPVLDSNAREAVRAKYALPEPFFLFVGTLEPRKNLVNLVRAFDIFKKETSLPHHLVLAGRRGWKYGSVMSEIHALGIEERVHLPGHIAETDLPTLYSLAEALVWSSYYEGFGLPPLEAMACGTAVVTSNVSSLPEVVGQAALLVDPTSPQEIAAAMEKLSADNSIRRALISAGFERAKKFTWEKAASETMKLYQKLAGDRA